MRRRLIKRLTILFAILLVAAACGSDSPATDDAAAADTTTTLTAADSTVASTAATTTTSLATDDHDDEAAEEDHHDDEAAEDHDDEAAEDHEHEIDPNADRQMEIIMDEFSFEPAVVTVAAGETVQFVVHNEGLVDHEFRLTTEHAALEHIESGHEGHDEGGGHEHDEKVLLLGPGETGTLTVAFDEHAEFNVVACLLPAHYEAGMHVPLSIEG